MRYRRSYKKTKSRARFEKVNEGGGEGGGGGLGVVT